jgi:hypothetical protein
VEGNRAEVIDKDRYPDCSLASLDAVTTRAANAYFEPADEELTFSEPVADR